MYGYILSRYVYIFLVRDMINVVYQKLDGVELEVLIKMKRLLRVIYNEVFINGDFVYRF